VDRTFFDYETERLRQMTPEQKLHALDALRRTALQLAEAGVRMRHPEWPSADVDREVRRLVLHDRA